MGLTSAWRAGELEDRSAELSYLKNREKAMIWKNELYLSDPQPNVKQCDMHVF